KRVMSTGSMPTDVTCGRANCHPVEEPGREHQEPVHRSECHRWHSNRSWPTEMRVYDHHSLHWSPSALTGMVLHGQQAFFLVGCGFRSSFADCSLSWRSFRHSFIRAKLS